MAERVFAIFLHFYVYKIEQVVIHLLEISILLLKKISYDHFFSKSKIKLRYHKFYLFYSKYRS